MHRRILMACATWVGFGALAAAQQAPTVDLTGSDCSSCGNAGSSSGLYGSINYILGEFRDGPAPPIIQHVPTSQLPPPGQGLNPDAARTLYGNGIRHHAFSGVTATIGFNVNDDCGFEGSYTQFERKSKDFFIQSGGEPSIGRYYYDLVNTGQPITYLIYARPDGVDATRGFINVQSPIRLWHADANLKIRGNALFGERFDWLVGVRYLDLRDAINIQDFTEFLGSGIGYIGEDQFSASNRFCGAQVGGSSWFDLSGGFRLDVVGKIAFGGVRQKVVIDGYTTELANGIPVRTVPGDVLTQVSNIGTYERTDFAVASEVQLKLGYQIGANLNVSIGYNISAISNVVRAGGVIDEGVNPNLNPYLIAGGNSDVRRPGFNFNGTDFWAQGVTAGVALNY